MVSLIQRRMAVEMVVGMGLCGCRRACRTIELARSTAYHRREASAARLAMEGLVEEVSMEWPSLGYKKVTALLRDEQWQRTNPKRVWRVRRERGLLASRKSCKRRRVSRNEAVRRSATQANEVWSYDFMSDATVEGRSVRILSVIDE
jgi:putative transposase